MKIETAALLPTPLQVNAILLRAAPLSDSPEAKLIIATIGQAVVDAMWREGVQPKGKLTKNQRETLSENRSCRASAKSFFRRGNYQVYCDLVGLNPTWVAEFLKKYAHIEC
jgi:hypothetical protein